MKTIDAVLRAGALVLAACAAFDVNVSVAQQNAEQSSKTTVDQAGTVRVPSYEVPLSIYMSDGAKRAYIDLNDVSLEGGPAAIGRRYVMRWLERAQTVYPVLIEEHRIAGVRTDVVVPKDGVAKRNQDRVLINLHGGGFLCARPLQLVESIPIASTARIKVISVDYRCAPEHKFPAASEDVAAVYKELLKQYKPRNIGIYGSSAGGALAAMSLAWFQKEKLPMPGAIGIFSPGEAISGGDSRYIAAALDPWSNWNPAPPAAPNPPPAVIAPEYLRGVDVKDPLVSPVLHPDVIARFPPTLLVSGTRDYLAGSLIHVHRQLIRADVEAQLHVFEGMWHSFHMDVDIPESKEMYEVTARFFNRHLGKPPVVD